MIQSPQLHYHNGILGFLQKSRPENPGIEFVDPASVLGLQVQYLAKVSILRGNLYSLEIEFS